MEIALSVPSLFSFKGLTWGCGGGRQSFHISRSSTNHFQSTLILQCFPSVPLTSQCLYVICVMPVALYYVLTSVLTCTPPPLACLPFLFIAASMSVSVAGMLCGEKLLCSFLASPQSTDPRAEQVCGWRQG